MPQQARRLQAIVARDLRFLMRLCRRMERLGFPPDDPLYRSALMAQHAIHELHVQAHYTGCTTGVGRRPA